MNAQQQNKINGLWEGILKAVILALIKDFGTEALEWLKGKIDELTDSGEVEAQENPAKDSHGCIIGRETWNGSQCVPDVGK